MKVLLLGGTGAIGCYLSSILSTNNIKHAITTRKNLSNTANVNYLIGNAHDIDFVTNLCSQHWDAIVDFMSYKTQEFKHHIKILLPATSQYIFISSARVYGDTEHPIKENSPRLLDCSSDMGYLSTDEYALTKGRQENILRESGYNNYTIIRPYITYGEERLQLGVLEKEEWLYRALNGRTIIFSENVANKLTTFTNGYDVANGIYSILGKENVLCDSIHITNPNQHTWRQIFEIYNKILKKHFNKELKITYVTDATFLRTRDASLLYQYKYDRLYNRDFSTKKQDQFVDSSRFISVEDGLEVCIKSFMANQKWKNIDWKFEAIKDRIVGERTFLKEIQGFKSKIKYLIYRWL